MTPDEILQRLRRPQPLPRAALHAGAEQADAVVPRIADVLGRAADLDRGVATEDESIVFFGVFVLAETGDTRGYRPLLTFLHGDTETVDRLLGDALTETLCQVLIRVADDPEPLLALVADPKANEYARSAALKAWARRALDMPLPFEAVRERLMRVYTGLEPEHAPFLAAQWGLVVAAFGLADFRPQVEQALRVQSSLLADYSMRAFDRDLERQAREGSRALMDRMGWTAFKGTAVDELARWHAFRNDRPTGAPSRGGNRNAYRNVGRNDPCVCGSGKKYKRCCGAA